MIDDNVSVGQAELNRQAIRCTHIHTHRFDRIRFPEPFKQRNDFFLFASSTHFQYLTSDQIAKDCIRVMPLAACILINSKKLRGVERLLLIQLQSFSFQFLECHGLETLLHEARTHSCGSSDMRKRLRASQRADLLAQTGGRLPAPATRRIRFGKGFVTRQTAKAAFQEEHFDAMLSQGTISFLSGSRIMNFDALPVTMRAGGLGGGCSHLHSNRPIGEPLLLHNMQPVQV